METNLHESFILLVRLGLGTSKDVEISKKDVEWFELKTLAEQQGLSAVVLDGIEKLQHDVTIPFDLKLQWIGEVLQGESVFAEQQKAAEKMARLFHQNKIRTYVLKGTVVSECYPKPAHRVSVDLDCYLRPEVGVFDSWSLGNDLIKEAGFDVNLEHYKNSTFTLQKLTVENHQFLTPFRGNKRMERLECKLQMMLREDKGEDRFVDTWLYRPPVMASAIFLIEHAYTHFLHEGLSWRHVLDWMMFSKKHHKEIDWTQLEAWIDEYGFRKFYDSYYRLGKYLVGEVKEFNSLSVQDRRMLADVWNELDLHETVRGVRGKLALAGNTWRARWKYSHFTDMSMIHALWIQVKGFLFMKNPKLN
jgi:hypothetical protein